MRALRVLRQKLTVIGIALALALVIPRVALAADPSAMVIRDLNTGEYPKVSLTVSLPADAAGDLSAKNFGLRENGEPISNFRLEPLNQAQHDLGIVLVLDASGSMKGKPLFDAKDAARIFIDGMKPGDRLAIVAFSSAPRLAVDFTADKTALYEALNGIDADGDTALYDGLYLALEATSRAKVSQPNIVVLSDGADTISAHTLDQIIQAANGQKAAIYAVGLSTPQFVEAPLQNLATQSKGRYSLAADSQILAAVYSGLSKELHNQYRLSYTSRTNERKVNLEINATTPAGPLTQNSEFESPMPVKTEPPATAAFDATSMPWLVPGIGGAAFMFWLIIAGVALSLVRRRSNLDDQLNFYGEDAAAGGKRASGREGILPDQPVVNRLVGAASAAAERGGFAAELQTELERAGLPLRASEFMFLHVAFTIGFGILMVIVFQAWWVRIIAVAVGSALPFLFVRFKRSRRAARLHEQLPDTLDLLAGALKAGYSFLQAVDTTAQETTPPIKTEFQRLVAETRLGSPIELALDQMAERIHSTNVDWTVMAVKIQREVGGNLAEILEILADTVRQRDQVSRQINALTGEGRLSAAILIILPFALAGVMTFVNPGYIGALFASPMGLTMLAVAGFLMIVGIVWLKKIITIDV